MNTWTWDEFYAAAKSFPDLCIVEGAGALYRIANDILSASQDIVPFDTGVLASTGMVTEPEVSGASFKQISVTIGYGGPAAPYALVQHESLEFKHPNGRQAKYLEQPMMEEANHLGEDIAQELVAAVLFEPS